MPFCTTCGANVTGTFCSQCGTPAAGAAAPAAQPTTAAPYTQPTTAAPYTQPTTAAPYAQPVPVVVVRKTSPIVWVLVIVLGLFLLGGIAVAGFVAFVAHRVHQVVHMDTSGDGGFTVHTRGNDGKDATVQFGGTRKLPSWVPVYPGSEGKAKFAFSGSAQGEGEAGSFVFTTTDDADRVKSFYADKAKEMGMKINLETTAADSQMIVAADEGDHQRSLSAIIGGHSGETTVNVTYARK
jgi:hypothetical protein